MKWAILAALGLLFGPILMLAPVLGLLTDPWSPFRLSGRTGTIATPAAPSLPVVPIAASDLSHAHGFVSDAQRYQLARAAGWSLADAIIATAISIAEDGSGDPAALSALNRDSSRDLGLWQINSAHWPEFGGAAALVDPFTNARAAIAIYRRQGWCAWSTFETSCGPGHTGSYRAFLARARAASDVQPLTGQA